MEAAGARRDPDLAVGRLAVDDHARLIGAGDGEDAGLEVAVEALGALDGALDAREHGVDGAVEFGLVHNAGMIRAPFSRAIGVVAAALALAFALPGCGQKGPLKLPEPPKPAEPAK